MKPPMCNLPPMPGVLPTAPKQFPSFIMDRALKRKKAKSIDMNALRSVPKRR
jgi:hypothetical protein